MYRKILIALACIVISAPASAQSSDTPCGLFQDPCPQGYLRPPDPYPYSPPGTETNIWTPGQPYTPPSSFSPTRGDSERYTQDLPTLPSWSDTAKNKIEGFPGTVGPNELNPDGGYSGSYRRRW